MCPCPWSPEYPLAPALPGASPASSRNPHRAQPRRGCQPVAVPPGHCRVRMRRSGFRTLSTAFAARLYPETWLCTLPAPTLCTQVGTFVSPECQEPSRRWLGARAPPQAPPKISSIPAGTEGKLARVGVAEHPALCSSAAGNKLFALDLSDNLAVTRKPTCCPRWGQTGLIPGELRALGTAGCKSQPAAGAFQSLKSSQAAATACGEGCNGRQP